MTFSRWLDEEMARRHITGGMLQARSGISRETIGRIRHGRDVRVSTAAVLASALGREFVIGREHHVLTEGMPTANVRRAA